MFESRARTILVPALLLVAAGVLVRSSLDPAPGFAVARSSRPEAATADLVGQTNRGYGASLRRFWTSPESGNESNHYFDLWSEGALPILARVNGLTNNHALIIDSHGKAVPRNSRKGSGFVLYPHESLTSFSDEPRFYSAKDFAEVLGPEQAAGIHNIFVAACNEGGKFQSQEWRRYFINATNIVYMTPGKMAYKPMFYQAIVVPSAQIKQLYGRTRQTATGRVECQTSDVPSPGAKPLGVYLADLYLPQAPKPFRTVKAGRELLEPDSVMLRADARR